ncbi:MAG: radical SAM protein [Candidatus Sumerlaeia bacterium]|nr:radical SAM protein [Candidatus Sumerlaeia bacterium]
MINISKLYCGEASGSDWLRYGEAGAAGESGRPRAVPKSAAERRPVVVWNSTRACNLRCIHCYTDSDTRIAPDELTTAEAQAMLRDLAAFRVPAVLMSGGEPLIRPDLFDLVAFANSLGLHCTLSTNGTLITEETAQRIRAAGFTYVGISLDGIGEVNDYFRGVEGAFERAMRGFRNCVAVGQRVGLRMTLTRQNVRDLDRIFDFIEGERIDRACFYHLAYSGRGSRMKAEDLAPEETRRALDCILDRTEDFHRRGIPKEILTVDNHADGVYVYLRLREKDPARAEKVLAQIRWNGGGLYSSGVGIGAIDWSGNVHPDQFWLHYSFGNIRQRPFSEIWTDTSDPLMRGLKDRRSHIRGQCRACRWFDGCGGALRVRADAIFGDPWAWDPACYLTDDEIGLTPEDVARLKAANDYFERPK